MRFVLMGRALVAGFGCLAALASLLAACAAASAQEAGPAPQQPAWATVCVAPSRSAAAACFLERQMALRINDTAPLAMSLRLDVAAPEGRELLLELIASADVFLTNFLPSALKKWRLDVDDVRAASARCRALSLIVCRNRLTRRTFSPRSSMVTSVSGTARQVRQVPSVRSASVMTVSAIGWL